MSESQSEIISSLVDNYQPNDELFDQIIEQIAKNNTDQVNCDNLLSDTWSHYHLIGDVIRDEVPDNIQLSIPSKVAQALADEPTILAPKAPNTLVKTLQNKVVYLFKPVGQLAIAASAAWLMILGVQQNVANNETVMPSQVFQTRPLAGVADPVSFNTQSSSIVSQKEAYIEQQRRFQALLIDHQQQIKYHSLESGKNKDASDKDTKVEK